MIAAIVRKIARWPLRGRCCADLIVHYMKHICSIARQVKRLLADASDLIPVRDDWRYGVLDGFGEDGLATYDKFVGHCRTMFSIWLPS